ncbi:autotransporter domain-containing protein, partial [Fusobacterium varium]|nr:autotransporter domain-containing protein [Fusobacterium varium]
MIEKIMKAVKRGNKRRGRNITIGAVIGFLLSCTAVMGADDNYLWIKEDGGEIKFSIDGTTTSDGDWKTDNPYEDAGNIWDTVKKTYTNNMTLSSSTANGNNSGNISYGLRLSGNLTDVNFVNNGSIIGKMSGSGSDKGYGFGIYNTGAIGNIANAGVISGTGSSSSGSGDGYGIVNNSGTMGNIENTGLISGTGISTSSSSYSTGTGIGIHNNISDDKQMGKITNIGIINGYGDGEGYGIYNTGTIGEITNAGEISGIGTNSGTGTGFGIYNDSDDKEMGAITNTGIISGTGNSTNNAGIGFAIHNKSGKIEAITNAGLISGTGIGFGTNFNGFGSGIYNTGTIGDIANTGEISGTGSSSSGYGTGYGIFNNAGTMKNVTNIGEISGIGSSSSDDGTGYGIYNYKSEIKNITNIGIISGYGKGSDSGSSGYGYGINNDSNDKKMGAITNTGVIYGKTNAINKNSGTIAPSSNYGILVNGDSNNDVVDGLTIVDETPKESEILNKGLIFTALDTGKYKADEDEYGKFGKTFDNDAGVTIINAKALGNGKDNITGTESLELKKGTLFYTDS